MTMTKTAHLRPAHETDLAQIFALLEASGLPTTGVADSLDGFIVADDAGEIVGVVGLETCCRDYALLRSTAVADAWRGRGVGRQLVERAIAEAELQGFQALYLLTTTAERYFPSFGFRAVPRDTVPADVREHEQFTGGCCSSATAMELGLGGR